MKKEILFLTTLVTILCLFIFKLSHADTKWVQPPNMGPALCADCHNPPIPDHISDWHSEHPTGPNVADDFLCSDPDPIIGVCWWGSYMDGLPVQPGIKWFKISFHFFDPTGLCFPSPGSMWMQFPATETYYGTTPDGEDIYYYCINSTDFEPFDQWVGEPTVWWIDIAYDDSMNMDQRMWGWHESATQWGCPAVQSYPPYNQGDPQEGPWLPLDNFETGPPIDMAFELYIADQPTMFPVFTECPQTFTECPLLPTTCLVADTECPEIATECPAVTTECPAIETVCPEWGDTYCPVADTMCPKVETFCPFEATFCPEFDPTFCPYIDTECFLYPTWCPIDTFCPDAPTFCWPAPTICEVLTSCPDDPTWCPLGQFIPTVCPMEVTFCPEIPTSCFPDIPTECPVFETICPGDWTYCPYNYTWCPGDIPTECPMDWTNCPAIPTVCPESFTVCPEIITTCLTSPTFCSTVDTDGDGVDDCNDNCPNHPNGPLQGTCTKTVAPNVIVSTGQFCFSVSDCDPGEFCEKVQADTYPPGGNGIGDACDCEGNFDCDVDTSVDADDVTTFLDDFGRSKYINPCTATLPCNGDFLCDGDVDADDVTKFLEDFGRSQYFKPCPSCPSGGTWCVYP